MVERFEAHIGADIREFKRKLKEVDREVRDLASGVDVDLDLATADFYAEMKTVQASLKGLENKDLRLQVELAYLEFKRQLAEVYMIAETLDDYDIDVEIDAITNEFNRKLLKAKALAQGLSGEVDIELDLDTSRFNRAYIATLAKVIALNSKEVVINLKVGYSRFQNIMGRIASVMRNWGEILSTQFTGFFISMIPTLSPIISSLIGLLGSLGVMIGVMGGQLLIMSGALSATALAFTGLAAVSIPTIAALFDETTKLTGAQQEAKKAFDGFIAVYDDLVAKTESAVLEAFTSAMQGASTVLKTLEPMILSVADAAAELMDSFNQAVNTEPIQSILEAFNEFSADIFTNMVEGIGHFITGLGSMMAALLPAGLQWSETFNGMMETFSNWAAALGENEKFQAFIAYVQENMPLISQLFADMIVGITNFFSAFSDMGAEFISGLAKMMEGFKEWSSELKNNQSFQEFLDYIRESAPDVLKLFGNLTELIVNLGVAMAPFGKVILDVTNYLIGLFNSAMDNFKAFEILVGAMPTVVGGFMMLLTPITLIISFMGTKMVNAIKIASSMFKSVGSVIARLAPHFGILIDDVLRAIGAVTNLASKALPWLVRGFGLLTGPVGVAIAIITTLITVGVALYKNWDEISAWASKTWSSVKKTISDAMSSVKQSIETKWGQAKAFLQSIDLVEIGKNIIQGLVRGLESVPIVGSVIKIGKSIASTFSKVLNIKSPSRVMADIAKWIPAGVAKGITDNINMVKQATKKMSNAVTLDFSVNTNKLSSTYKNLASVIQSTAKANERAIKETTKVNGKTVTTYMKKSNAERYEAFESSLSEHKKFNNISAQYERAYWLDAAKHLKAGTAARRKALENANAAEAQMMQEKFEKETNFIDKSREYGVLSLRDQIRAYQNYMKEYKERTDQQIAYEELLYGKKKELFENLKDIANDYASRVQDVYKTLADEEQKLRDEYQKTYEARRDTLANTWGLFDEVKLTEMVTYKEDGTVDKQIDLIGNMRQQVNTLSNWMHDIFRLQSFGLDEALLDELRNMGPKAAAEINALANMSSQQLGEYEMLWKAKMELAGKQAASELAGAREEMETEIVKLRENAMDEIEKLRNEMLSEIDKMVNGTNDGFNVLNKTLPEIGKEAIKGLINGLNSMNGQLKSTAQKLARDVSSSLSSILSGGAYSPNLNLAAPGVNAQSVLNTNVHSETELKQSPAIVNITSTWSGSDVKYWIDEQDATNARLNIMKA